MIGERHILKYADNSTCKINLASLLNYYNELLADYDIVKCFFDEQEHEAETLLEIIQLSHAKTSCGLLKSAPRSSFKKPSC